MNAVTQTERDHAKHVKRLNSITNERAWPKLLEGLRDISRINGMPRNELERLEARRLMTKLLERL